MGVEPKSIRVVKVGFHGGSNPQVSELHVAVADVVLSWAAVMTMMGISDVQTRKGW